MARTEGAYSIRLRKIPLASGKTKKVYYYKLRGMSGYKTTEKETKNDALEYVLGLIEAKRRLQEPNGNDKPFNEFVKDFYTENCPYCNFKASIGKPLSINSIIAYKSIFKNYINNDRINPFFYKYLSTITPVDIQALYNSFILNNVPKSAYLNIDVILRHIFFQAKKDLNIIWFNHPLSDRKSINLNKENDKNKVKKGRLSEEEIAEMFKNNDIVLFKTNEKINADEYDENFTYDNTITYDEKRRVYNPPLNKLYKNIRVYFPFYNHRDRTLIYMAYTTGCRIGELQSLKWSDIDLLEGYWNLKTNFQAKLKGEIILGGTKNKKGRIVPLEKKLINYLRYWRAMSNFTNPDDFVFVGPKGKIMTDDWIRNIFYKALEQIGIKEEERIKRNITFHSLRHTSNSILVEKNVNPEIIRRTYGWGDAQIQKIYTELSKPSLKEVSSKIGEMFRNDLIERNDESILKLSNIGADNRVYAKVYKYEYDDLKRQKENIEKALENVAKERDELLKYNDEIRKEYYMAREMYNRIVSEYKNLTGRIPIDYFKLKDLKPFIRQLDNPILQKIIDEHYNKEEEDAN